MSDINIGPMPGESLFGGLTTRPVQRDTAMASPLKGSMSPIETVIQDIDKIVDVLFSDIAALAERLTPISRRLDRAQPDSNPFVGESQVVTSLTTQHRRLSELHYGLLAIMEQLEV